MSLESDQAQHARLWHAGHVEAESLTFDLSNLSFSIVQSHPWYSLPPHTGYGGYSPAGAWRKTDHQRLALQPFERAAEYSQLQA